MSTTNNRLQISAAVLLLLAGCGGGGGGSEAPKAVSASPSATTTATNSTATANVAAADAAAAAAANSASAAASNAAATAAANAAAQRTAEQAANQAAAQANVARNAAAQATAALQAAQAAAQEANAKRTEAEAANKRAAEAEAALQKATAERRAAEEAQAKAAREDAARKQAEAAAAAKAKEEADAKAKAEEEKAKQAEAKAKEEAAAAAKAKEEAEAKAKAEEEAKAKEEEARQAAARAVPASSNNGVSGLLLATMLDQAMTTNRTQQADAEALPAEGVTGDFLEDADAPTVNAAQYTDPSNYVGGGNGQAGNYLPANGTYYYHLFNGGVAKAGKDAAFPMATVGIKLKVEASADKVELDNELKVSDTIGATSIEAAPTFSGGELSIQKNGLVSRIEQGGVIATWFGSNKQSVQLILRESSESGATLCWNYTLTNTNRLYCNIWQIQAGWKAGEALTFLGYYIHETRTVDGGQKSYYWRTRTH